MRLSKLERIAGAILVGITLANPLYAYAHAIPPNKCDKYSTLAQLFGRRAIEFGKKADKESKEAVDARLKGNKKDWFEHSRKSIRNLEMVWIYRQEGRRMIGLYKKCLRGEKPPLPSHGLRNY